MTDPEIDGLDGQERIQTHQEQELENSQDKSWHGSGNMLCSTWTGEIPPCVPRSERTPQHSAAQAPARKREEGCGSQPAETTIITSLKAEAFRRKEVLEDRTPCPCQQHTNTQHQHGQQ